MDPDGHLYGQEPHVLVEDQRTGVVDKAAGLHQDRDQVSQAQSQKVGGVGVNQVEGLRVCETTVVLNVLLSSGFGTRLSSWDKPPNHHQAP